MKITFLTPHINISGGVKIILGYADRLIRRGHEVTVICPQPALTRRAISKDIALQRVGGLYQVKERRAKR